MNALRFSWVLGLLGLLGVVAFASLWYVNGVVGPLAQVLGVGGALALVAYAFLDREALASGTSAREIMSTASSALVLVLAALFGVLAYSLIERADQTVDLTSERTWSLSSRTASVLDGITEEVKIYALFRKGAPDGERFERVAGLYTQRNPAVSVEIIDPLMQPARARSLVQSTGNAEMDRLSEAGTVLLQSGSRRRRLEARFAEEALTNAIVKLTSGQDRRLCWSVGHGERDADDDQGALGWGVTVLRLEDRNVVVTEQRILTAGVDRACEALAIIGPTRDFQPRELEAVAAYIAEGGQVMLALDAPNPEGVQVPLLISELDRFGIAMADDAILENSQDNVTADPAGEPLMVYDRRSFKAHPIVDPLEGLAFRWPRSVQATDAAVGIQVAEIVASSEMSWAEPNFDLMSEEMPQPDPGETLGPVPFVVVAEVQDPGVLGVGSNAPPPADTDDPAGPVVLQNQGSLVPDDLQLRPGGRLVVFGDADFAANPLSSLINNGDLALNTFSFLLGEDDQLGADEASGEYLTLSESQAALLGLMGVGLVPGLSALAGILLLVRRRFM